MNLDYQLLGQIGYFITSYEGRKIQIKISEVTLLPQHSAAPKSECAWRLVNRHFSEGVPGK